MNSMHIGSSAPASVTTGTMWVDNGTSGVLKVKINDGSADFIIVNAVSIPPNSKIEILKGKFVLGSGYKLKATSGDSSGNIDIVMGLLTDVT